MVVECIKSVRVFGKTIIAKGRIVDTEDFINNGLDSSPLRIDFCDDEYFKPYEPKYKDVISISVKNVMVLLTVMPRKINVVLSLKIIVS